MQQVTYNRTSSGKRQAVLNYRKGGEEWSPLYKATFFQCFIKPARTNEQKPEQKRARTHALLLA
jgi:hypothetical protein